MSTPTSQVRFLARLTVIGLAGLLTALAVSLTTREEGAGRSGDGSPEDPIEVVLPFEMQAALHHSLPIAGHLVTPDDVAQRVLRDPRLD